MDDTHDILAAILQRTDGYRVLRRVPMPPMGASPPGAGLATAIIIDTETTGLDPATDEVIELAMVKLEFDPHTAEVHQVSGLFTGLRDPNRPIPPEIVRLTRLTDEAVAGRTIDPADVERFVAGAVMVIAHNSAFDRPFVERVWPVFATLPWACSLTQVDWRSEGAEGSKLGHLLTAKGSSSTAIARSTTASPWSTCSACRWARARPPSGRCCWRPRRPASGCGPSMPRSGPKTA